MGGRGVKSEVSWRLGGVYREESGTHPAGSELPVEGLGPRQHPPRSASWSAPVDVLQEGVGQARLPAGTQPPRPSACSCASRWGHSGGKTQGAGP